MKDCGPAHAAWETACHISPAGHRIGKMTAFLTDWLTLYN
jgi:hypothetical protein